MYELCNVQYELRAGAILRREKTLSRYRIARFELSGRGSDISDGHRTDFQCDLSRHTRFDLR